MLTEIMEARNTIEPITRVMATAARNGSTARAISFANSDLLPPVC
jgi:hypothetical protein